MNPKPSSSRKASPTRVSRRQQGLQPEFGLLPDNVKKEDVVKTTMISADTMTSASYPALLLQQPKQPPSCHGSPSEEPQDWFEQVERIRLFNRRDDAETLRQVFFYLEDSARIWFENDESSLETWNDFRTQLLTTFTKVVRKERAEVLLQTRAQNPNESVVVFADEMKWLFRRADP